MINKGNEELNKSIEALKRSKREREKILKDFLNEKPNMQTILHETEKTLEKAEKYDFTPFLNVKSGSIIRINRGYYYHYGIYSGNNEVIHYLGSFPNKKEITKTHIKVFLDGQDRCEFIDVKDGYSNKESLRRATSYIGRKDYDLFFNNCEHFAIWCKTGQKISLQANKVILPIVQLLFN